MKKFLFGLSIFAVVLSCSSDETSTPVTPPAPIVKYTITLSAGEGGAVSTTGGEYEAGQTVSVTATPQGEYLFKDWSDGNTDATRTITVSSNLTLTASFEKRKYPLTVNFVGEGEVIEEAVNAGRTTDYDSGTTVKLTAQAAAEWVFVGWTGDVESTEASVQILIGESKEVTATFEKKKYPLTVNIEGEGEVLEEIIEAGRSIDYESGNTIKLTAVPSEGWEFVGWSGDLMSDEIQVQFTLNSEFEIKAEFNQINTSVNETTSLINDNKAFIYINQEQWFAPMFFNDFNDYYFTNDYSVANYQKQWPYFYHDFNVNGTKSFFTIFQKNRDNQDEFSRSLLFLSENIINLQRPYDFTQLSKSEFSLINGGLGTTTPKLGDFDNDGFLDVFILGSGLDLPPYPGGFDGVFYPKQNKYIEFGHKGFHHGGSVGDIDNDGDIDAMSQWRNQIIIYENKGNYEFDERIIYLDDVTERYSPNSENFPFGMNNLYDINGDNKLDIIFGDDKVMGNGGDGLLGIVYGNGDLSFDFNNQLLMMLSPGQRPYDVFFYDFNSDNKEDILLLSTLNNYTGYSIDVLIKQADNTFELSTQDYIEDYSMNNTKCWYFKIYMKDINNDGNLDIVPYTTKDDCFTDGKMYYWNNSDGVFKKTPLEFDGRLIAN